MIGKERRESWTPEKDFKKETGTSYLVSDRRTTYIAKWTRHGWLALGYRIELITEVMPLPEPSSGTPKSYDSIGVG